MQSYFWLTFYTAKYTTTIFVKDSYQFTVVHLLSYRPTLQSVRYWQATCIFLIQFALALVNECRVQKQLTQYSAYKCP
jgi:hypothetical protein